MKGSELFDDDAENEFPRFNSSELELGNLLGTISIKKMYLKTHLVHHLLIKVVNGAPVLSPEVQKVTHTLLPAWGDNVWVGLDDSTGAPLNINSIGAPLVLRRGTSGLTAIYYFD